MNHDDIIDTERLRLRPLATADAARLAALAGDPGVARMTCALPHPYVESDAVAYIAAATRPDARGRAFAVEAAGELAGVVGLRPEGERGPWPELGYWLGRPYWGRGLATEATGAALRWANQDWGKRAVVAGHFEDNPASARVLEKAGFLYTGDRLAQHSLARGGAATSRRMVWLA